MFIEKIRQFFGLGGAAVATALIDNKNPPEAPTSPMDEKFFWRIIAATTQMKRDPEQQCELLNEQLVSLTATKIASFELRFGNFGDR